MWYTEEYVYFIHERGNLKVFKIGMTTGDPDYRRRKLQTGNPKDLVIFAVVKVTDARNYESQLHRHFLKHRIRGEWFRISPKMIRRVCSGDIGYEEKESIGCCWFL